MKHNLKIIGLLGLITLMLSCKKEGIPKEPIPAYCWQIVDALGNNITAVCDKTVSEIQSLYPNPCSYFKIEGPEFCWFIDSQFFVKNATESSLNHHLQCYGRTNAIKVRCDYCQNWYSRKKHTFKPNSTFFYSPVRLQRYCGDTVQTLFQGREIILKESADSIITLQFSNNGIF